MKQGIFDISNEEYHHGEVFKKILGSTWLKKLYDQTPAHVKAEMEQEAEDPTPALIFGAAYHVYVLEHDSFDDKVAVAPADINRRTKAGKEEWNKFVLDNENKIIISEDDIYKMAEMRDALLSYKTAGAIFKNKGYFESTVIWQDASFGFWCKARPDFHIPSIKLIIDLKTTSDASPKGFAKSIANFHLDISAAWYKTGLDITTGENYQYIFLAQEKTKPYAVGIYLADQAILDNGRRKIRPLLQIWNDCLTNDSWPGYEDKVTNLTLPNWALID